MILTYFNAFMPGLTSQLLQGWFGFALFPPLTLQSSENKTKQNHFRIYVGRVTTCFLPLITSEVKCKRKQMKLCLLQFPFYHSASQATEPTVVKGPCRTPERQKKGLGAFLHYWPVYLHILFFLIRSKRRENV